MIDNGSTPEAVPHISKAAQEAGATFYQQQAVPHYHFLRQMIFAADRPLVFADPDLIFWDRMTVPDVPLAGRLIPAFADEYTGTATRARLHTSLLMVRPDLKREIAKIEAKYWEADLLRPVMLPAKNGWIRYDTAAALYEAVGGHAFTDAELDCYDHLFCGSHLSAVAHTLTKDSRDDMIDSHEKAKAGDFAPLRGIWRKQQTHFEVRA